MGLGAAGFDWMPGWGPWHVSGQVRYGSAQKTQGVNTLFPPHFETIIVPSGTTFVGTLTNNEKIRDEHWVVDFAIGRDFGLGNANAQWKLGLRVVDLRARLTASGISNTTGALVFNPPFNTQQNATFVGAGPRFGVEGSTPLAAGWSFDWLAGAAVLVGERHTSQTTLSFIPAPPGGIATPAALLTGQATEQTTAVFNVDAQAGLSYWLSPNLKITASYRVDAYFNALKTIKAGTANNNFRERGSDLQRSDASADVEFLIDDRIAFHPCSWGGIFASPFFFFCWLKDGIHSRIRIPTHCEFCFPSCPRLSRASR
jgi:hypothetical protein